MKPCTLLLLAGLFICPVLSGQTTRYRDPIFPSFNLKSNIPYGSAFNPVTSQTETLLLDLYTPTGDTAPARAAVVMVHGGGFNGGDKANRHLVKACKELVLRGYLAVSINYRLLGSANLALAIQAAKEDFKASVRFLRANATAWAVDTSRIAGFGVSAGAMTALAGAYVPGEGQSGNPGWSSEIHVVADLSGGLGNVLEIQAGEPPVIIIHGTNDPIVSFQYALDIAQQAQLVGIPYELHALQGFGHGTLNFTLQNLMDDVFAFYWEHMRLGQIAGLQVSPGFGSPGLLTLHAFGIAADDRILATALPAPPLPVPGLGALCLDLPTLYILPTAPFPATPRLPAASFSIAIPAGLSGLTLNWQELHTSPVGVPRLITNCVTTGF